MRGKAYTSKAGKPGFGITPAYAGKRFVLSPDPVLLRDHPRLCGEKQFCYFFVNSTPGSPPPMRGKARFPFCKVLPIGITPAYAGKSMKTAQNTIVIGDHPRLCGEKTLDTARSANFVGSPPPMRGKACGSRCYLSAPGITPAYAGKSTICILPSARCRDHPRLCGEKIFADFKHFVWQGSPPPMRGKDLNLRTCFQMLGITPAYAGKRRSKHRLEGTGWDQCH